MANTDIVEYSEADWKSQIEQALSNTAGSYNIFTLKREYRNGAYYIVNFAIRTSIDNVEAVDALINFTQEVDSAGYFKGSEVDLVNGNLEYDFLYFDAKVYRKVT